MKKKLLRFLILLCLTMSVSMILTPAIAAQGDPLEVERVDYLMKLNGYWAIQIRFDRNIDRQDTQSVENEPSIRNYIEINGFTLGEIADGGKDSNGNAVESPVMAHRMANGNDSRIVLHLFIPKKLRLKPAVFASVNKIRLKCLPVLHR